MKLQWIRVVVLLLLAAVSVAQTAKGPALDCDHAESTAEMRMCAAARYADAQRDMESAYRSLARRLDPGPRAKLEVAQRAWLRYRDANADFQQSLYEGGTLAPVLRATSVTEMTKARAEELKKVEWP